MGADFSNLTSAIEDLVLNAGDEAALQVFNGLDVPVGDGPDAGATRDSGNVDYLGGGNGSGEWSITFDTPQALFTDEGTVAYDIIGSPLLAFEWNGQTVIVHSVHHPGITGTGWFSDHVTEETWGAAVENAIAQFAP